MLNEIKIIFVCFKIIWYHLTPPISHSYIINNNHCFSAFDINIKTDFIN